MKPFNIVIIYLVVCYLQRGVQLLDKILFSDFTLWSIASYIEILIFFYVLDTEEFHKMVWKKDSTNTLK